MNFIKIKRKSHPSIPTIKHKKHKYLSNRWPKIEKNNEPTDIQSNKFLKKKKFGIGENS